MALMVSNITIPANQSLSDALDCHGGRIARIGTPAAWDAAALTFQIAALPLYDTPPAPADYLNLCHITQTPEGTWVAYEAVLPRVLPGSLLLMPSGLGVGISWLKLRSGTKQTPVPQTSARVFTLVFDNP
jgi:hypothetical protein